MELDGSDWRCYFKDGLRQTGASYDWIWGLGLRTELKSRTHTSARASNNWRLRAKNSMLSKGKRISRMGFDFTVPK